MTDQRPHDPVPAGDDPTAEQPPDPNRPRLCDSHRAIDDCPHVTLAAATLADLADGEDAA